MERILKILGIAAIIFLLIYWISDISKGCNGSKDIDTATEEVIQTADQNGEEEVDLEEDIFGDEQAEVEDKKASRNSSEELSTDKKENVEDYVDYSGDVKETKKTTKANNIKTSVSKKASVKSSKATDSKYLVVAGSYLVKDNANKMKRKLYNLGYNSEIVNFDLSQYYSVLAGRFRSRKEANEAVTILKRSGIDCYVHRKKN